MIFLDKIKESLYKLINIIFENYFVLILYHLSKSKFNFKILKLTQKRKELNMKKNTAKIVAFTGVLCVIFSLGILLIKNRYIKNKTEKITQSIVSNLEESKDEKKENSKNNRIFQDGTIGFIIIPSIDVNAPISEGIGKEVLKYTVRTF